MHTNSSQIFTNTEKCTHEKGLLKEDVDGEGKKKVLFPFGILGNQGWDKTTTVRC